MLLDHAQTGKKGTGSKERKHIEYQYDDREDAKELDHGTQTGEAAGQLSLVVGETGGLGGTGELESLDDGLDVEGGHSQIEHAQECASDS